MGTNKMSSLDGVYAPADVYLFPSDHSGGKDPMTGDGNSIREALAYYSAGLATGPASSRRLNDALAALLLLERAATNGEEVSTREAHAADVCLARAEAAEERVRQLEEALRESEQRFVMIENEGEAQHYDSLNSDEGTLQLVHTIGLMGGIAERGKAEARALLVSVAQGKQEP